MGFFRVLKGIATLGVSELLRSDPPPPPPDPNVAIEEEKRRARKRDQDLRARISAGGRPSTFGTSALGLTNTANVRRKVLFGD